MNESHWVGLGVACRSRAAAAQSFGSYKLCWLLQTAVTFGVLLLLSYIQCECALHSVQHYMQKANSCLGDACDVCALQH